MTSMNIFKKELAVACDREDEVYDKMLDSENWKHSDFQRRIFEKICGEAARMGK
ncbi:MAG: hypothetical protein ACAH80_17540 [Alphaproteobacteria bacterium]